MDIYIQSTIGPCDQYINPDTKEREEISIIISPLKITSKEDVIKVSSGCNLFNACQNSKCQYSLSGLHLRMGAKTKEGA
jgi:hypothetical protein